MTSALVGTEWLAENLNSPGVRVIDASWHMPSDGRDAEAEFKQAHIPGATFMDIDAISDVDSSYPHMLPSEQMFATAMSQAGIRNENHVIVYDTQGLFSAARMWWMLRVFGHLNVSVLDGGLLKWKAEGRDVTTEEEVWPSSEYTANLMPDMVRVIEEVAEVSKTGCACIVDARGATRFAGQVPEPRAGLRAGHIPGSNNIPYASLLEPPHQTMKDKASLKAIFAAADIDGTRPVITSCGSGVTACILALAMHELGYDDVSVYDGSWAEWGAREDVPVATDKDAA